MKIKTLSYFLNLKFMHILLATLPLHKYCKKYDKIINKRVEKFLYLPIER